MHKFSILWVSLVAFLSFEAGAQQIHISHCLDVCPEVSRADNEVVLHHLFAASVRSGSGMVEWVAYRVLPDSVGVASLLPRWWQDDELLQNELSVPGTEQGANFIQPDLSNAQDREYRTSEVFLASEDRGRLAPMTSFAGTPYWSELNLASNMSDLPQAMRTGAWSALDQAINELSTSGSELYVVAGPVSANQLQLDNENPAFFKVVSDGERVAAFLFASDLPPHARFCEQQTSLLEVQRAASLSLFPDRSLLDNDALSVALGCGR